MRGSSALRWAGGTLALLLLLSASRGLADDPKGSEAAPAWWIFDVRVVRVDVTDPTTVQTPPAFAATDDATTDATWASLLQTLAARGMTRVLLDQRVTGESGRKVHVEQSDHVQAESLANRTDKMSTWVGTNRDTGVLADLTMGQGLDYMVEVRWLPPGVSLGTAGPQASTQWSGTAPPPGQRTLVLRHARQLDTGQGGKQGVEIYVFLTARPAARH